MGQLQAELSEKHGYQILAISQDTNEKNVKVMKQQKLGFPIYSDPELEAAGKFGLVFKIDDKTNALYKQYNIDLEALYGRAQPLMPVPAVFVLDAESKIIFQYVNPDYRMRLSPKILEAVLAQ